NDICNHLANTFANNSSNNHYSPRFQAYKATKEATPVSFRSQNHEYYNGTFSLEELNDALHHVRDSSPGPDGIHYSFVRNLPSGSLQLLLKLFNKLFEYGTFPTSWNQALVVPM